jgi:hypothetical protein
MKCLMLLLLAGALAVGGCGGRTYYKNPDATPAQEERDYRECDYEASRFTVALPEKETRTERLEELRDKCMRARGYAPE